MDLAEGGMSSIVLRHLGSPVHGLPAHPSGVDTHPPSGVGECSNPRPGSASRRDDPPAVRTGSSLALFSRASSDDPLKQDLTPQTWRNNMMKQPKNTICLWYDGGAEEAARFYAQTFPDSSVGAVLRAPGDFPSGKQGDVLTVEFTVVGIPCLGSMADPSLSTAKHSPSRSQPLTRQRPIVTETRSWATVAKRVCAAGAKTNGVAPGRLPHGL